MKELFFFKFKELKFYYRRFTPKTDTTPIMKQYVERNLKMQIEFIKLIFKNFITK